MTFTRGWVTFVQALALPEILTGKLVKDFEFLRTMHLGYPPADLPSLKQVGKVCPIARSELLGLDRHSRIEKLFRCIAPHYPIQIAPEMGISFQAKGFTFSQSTLRISLHAFGIVLALGTRFEVEPDAGPVDGFVLARVLNNLERNRGVRAASRAFHQPKSVLDILYQLRRFLVPLMLETRVPFDPGRRLFVVLSPDQDDLPGKPGDMPDGQPDRLALFCALQRYTGNEGSGPATLGNKCFTSEGATSFDGTLQGWTFGSEDGIALLTRPQMSGIVTSKRRHCHHKNITRMIGWRLLYQDFLEKAAVIRPEMPPEWLQHAVDASDRLAVRYSKYWINWARRRFDLDAPLKLVVKQHGLTRLHAPDESAPLPESNTRAFVSYSHKDSRFLEELQKHLNLLQQERILASWSDRKLLPGDDWDGKINENLKLANLILLLVSADFLNSTYVRNTEIPLAMDKHESGEARVIPVILDETDWKAQPFKMLQALPSGAKPVSKWRSRRSAAADVAAGIRVLLAHAGS